MAERKHTRHPAVQNLRDCQRQLDMDGCEVGVSRQALDETLALLDQLTEALREGRRAVGDHWAPNDCYATGPVTGDPIRDLVQCPACSFIALFEAAIAKVEGQ